MNVSDSDQSRLVPAIERAAIILDLVSVSRKFMTVSELARESSLPKSTVHTVCTTLVQLDLLSRRFDQTYTLGPHVLRWANAFNRQTDIAAEFSALADQAEIDDDLIVSLSVPDQNEVVFLAARQAASNHRIEIRPGMRVPAPFVASGKAILSAMPDFEVRRMFVGTFPFALTSRSHNSFDALLVDLQKCREQGFAVDDEESQLGVTNFASVVFNSLGEPMAAVMLSANSEVAHAKPDNALALLIAKLASRLSSRMGAPKQPAAL